MRRCESIAGSLCSPALHSRGGAGVRAASTRSSKISPLLAAGDRGRDRGDHAAAREGPRGQTDAREQQRSRRRATAHRQGTTKPSSCFARRKKKFPGNARVAANLGTALELKGENEEALKWIREGVIRDASEHDGSEWLHARILDGEDRAQRRIRSGSKRTACWRWISAPAMCRWRRKSCRSKRASSKAPTDLLQQIDYQLDGAHEIRSSRRIPFVGDLYASAGDLAIAAGLSPLDDGHSRIARPVLRGGAEIRRASRGPDPQTARALPGRPGQGAAAETEDGSEGASASDVVDYPAPPKSNP